MIKCPSILHRIPKGTCLNFFLMKISPMKECNQFSNGSRCTVAQLPTYTIKHVNIQHILTWGSFMYHCNIYVKRFYFNMGLISMFNWKIFQLICKIRLNHFKLQHHDLEDACDQFNVACCLFPLAKKCRGMRPYIVFTT